jgi:hypothetical protein
MTGFFCITAPRNHRLPIVAPAHYRFHDDNPSQELNVMRSRWWPVLDREKGKGNGVTVEWGVWGLSRRFPKTEKMKVLRLWR